MTQRELKAGEIVQINPECTAVNQALRGHLMVVTEPKNWGAIGYVRPVDQPDALCFVRVAWADMEPTGGCVVWDVEA